MKSIIYTRYELGKISVIYTVNVPFICQRCGKCCESTSVPIEKVTFNRIANYLNLSVEEMIDKYIGQVSEDGKSFTRYDREPCVFLNDKNCEIYPVRPHGCMMYPKVDFGAFRNESGKVTCPTSIR